MNEAYNIDCLEYMKTLPDNAFDLACVDPPFGAGFTEGGGCKGWFSKYHQEQEKEKNPELGAHYVGRGKQKRYAEAYESEACSQSVQVERERSGITASEAPEAYSSDTSVTRTGGTRAAKHGKKLSRGTLRREKNTSKSFSASHAIRSFGAETILLCRLPDAF